MVRRRARRCATGLAICAAGLIAACGRVDFDALGDGGGSNPREIDAAIDAPPARIAYMGPFVARDAGTGATGSFTAQARRAGDAIVIQVACGAAADPTAVSVVAPGWTFTQLGPITTSSASTEHAATFAAIAPNTVGVTVTVSWTGSNCNGSKNDVGDEFAMTDPAGGAITFDGVAATEGTGNCIGSVRTGHAGDAVWAACDSADSVNAVGTGFTKGADDSVGDWSEYQLTDHPAGSLEAVEFVNDNVGYVLSMVTLKPAG